MLEQILERFGSNRLGVAPSEFNTSEHRIDLLLIVFLGVDLIPNIFRGSPALDSTESYCAWSVGSRMAQLRGLGAGLALLETAIHGRRSRRRWPPHTPRMHQDI